MLWARETEAATSRHARAAGRAGAPHAATSLAPIRDDTVRKHYRAEMEARLRALVRPARAISRGASAAAWRDRTASPAGARLRSRPQRHGPRSRKARWCAAAAATSAAEALILAAVIAHPFLLDQHCEALADLEFDNAEADRLRRALVDCAAHGLARRRGRQTPPRGGLGVDRLLDRLDRAVRRCTGGCGPMPLAPDVEQAFQHVLTLHRKMRTLHRELEARGLALSSEDLTDENFAHLADIKAQIAAVEGAEATIEGFGARPAGRRAQCERTVERARVKNGLILGRLV